MVYITIYENSWNIHGNSCRIKTRQLVLFNMNFYELAMN